jgi:putative zinc finger/helix-turn-helix YgiT family protein
MKCIVCGHDVEPEAPRTVEAELKGEPVSVELSAPQCANCGEVVILGKHVRAYHRAVSDAYRRKVGLLTIDEIDSLRRNLNMTLPEFASYLSVGIATLKRWRRGEIQTEALDRLVRLRADLQYAESAASELRAHLARVAMTRDALARSVFKLDFFGHATQRVAVSSFGRGSDSWSDSEVIQESPLAA